MYTPKPDSCYCCTQPLPFLQEVGRPEGREALSVGLVDAVEKERSLVLSIPAGSRTLREVGQKMHSENQAKKNKKKKESAADGEFLDQVSQHRTNKSGT